MTLLRSLADNTKQTSVATRMRRRRFAFFAQLVTRVPRPMKLLDVGGTSRYWELMGWSNEPGVDITLLNVAPAAGATIRSVVGDARSMPQFGDGEFDIVFSNSVIEHVGGCDDQAQMAAEIVRVGRRHFVQTPNRHFPIEPHFLFPGFQFLPISARVWLLSHFDLPGYRRIPDRDQARSAVTSIRLLDRKEFCRLFPRSSLYVERFGGLAKSFVAYQGFDR